MKKKKNKHQSGHPSQVQSSHPNQLNQSANQKRRIMIATPSYDGKLDAWYTNGILNTDRICRENNIQLDPIYVCYDAVIAKSRNDLFAFAYKQNYDDLVFIDADIAWGPDQFMQLISHPVDLVAGIYPKKAKIEDYPVNFLTDKMGISNGLMEVASVPTGFMRLSRNAIKILWDQSSSYTVNQDTEIYKMVFEVGIVGGRFISEDIIMCLKWRELGHKLYLDPFIKLNHVGHNLFESNFVNYIKKQYNIDVRS